MCGIFGIYNLNHEKVDITTLERMEVTIRSRGPDDRSFYLDGFVGLGMNRLSILDIDKGTQPFVSEDGNIIVFQNGEIYNYVEIKKILEKKGVKFKTHSDTEVVLKAYETWGCDFVSQLNGMFAITVYDAKTKILRLFRDRIGVKPLFFYKGNEKIVFASEIKAILEADVQKKLDLESLNRGMLYGYIPCPRTLFQGIHHIQPGCYLEIHPSGNMIENKWWNIYNYLSPNNHSFREAQSNIADLFEDATKIRLRSDVEVGAFLSGGLDSSYVVGVASRYSDKPIKTYSIGFNKKRFDETPFALEASKRFNTKHTVSYLNVDAMDLWKCVVHFNDQPHSDVSFIPTYRVSELASKSLKVVLTGDGGDELFGGYEKYHFFDNIDSLPRSRGDQLKLYAKENLFIMNDEIRSSLFNGTKMQSFSFENDSRYFQDIARDFDQADPINSALVFDMIHLMPSNNLVKPDRMGMANSIEARSPFLDFRLIEYVFGLPGKYKIHQGEKKYILKNSVENLLGKDLTYRKKQMFTVPIGDWFKTSLAPILKDKLSSTLLKEFSFFDTSVLHQLVDQHISNKQNHTRLLRFLMSFSYFLDEHFGDTHV